MPQIKSAKKRVRQDEKRTAQNKSQISAAKTAVKKFNAAVENGDDSARDLYRQAEKAVDIVADKNLIHKNKAARIKSKMATKLNTNQL